MTDASAAHVMIDGQEYKVADLSEQAKAQITHLRAAEAELNRLNMLTAMIRTAHAGYALALKQEIEKAGK